MIRAISRSIPSTHNLYVKEHRGCIGEKPFGFYKAIKSIPGVELIDPMVDSHKLIRFADLVISISGTIIYEAALYGKPSMAVAPMYFGPILTANGMNPYQVSFNDIFSLLGTDHDYNLCRDKYQANIEFLAWIIAQSFRGVISDPRTDPSCLSPDNLDSVAGAMDIIASKQNELQHSQYSLV